MNKEIEAYEGELSELRLRVKELETELSWMKYKRFEKTETWSEKTVEQDKFY